eukprot:5346393-Prorocentrum_lima.AAC.1
MQEVIRRSLLETSVRESDLTEEAALAIAIERSRVDTEHDPNVDTGAASSAAPAPAAKRWSRPTAAKSTSENVPGELAQTAPGRGRS